MNRGPRAVEYIAFLISFLKELLDLLIENDGKILEFADLQVLLRY